MAKRLSSDVYRQLDAICRGGTTAGLSDAELIDRFVGRTDRAVAEAAFEAIVRRHGPMVLGLCRKIARDPTDAEDAFQATFLVLARKAGSVRLHDDDSLGRWLSGTARRVATRASRQAKRRRDAEGGSVPEAVSATPGPAEAVIARERAALVREEVARLPERYRAAVELCHLDGRSIDEASVQLGQPSGTIKVHLMRARALLRDRLSRRGFSTADMPMPVVPAVLVHRTVRLVAVDAFGSATASGLGAMGTGAALKLAEGVLTMMGWAKVQGAGAAVLCVGIGAAAVGGWVVGEGDGTAKGAGGTVVVVPDDERVDAPRSVDDSKVGPILSSVPARHVLITRLENAKAVLDGLNNQSRTMEQARERLDEQIADTERLIEELSTQLQGGGSNREERSLPLTPTPRDRVTFEVPDQKAPEPNDLTSKVTDHESSERNDLKFFIYVPDEVVLGASFQVSFGVQNRGDRTFRELRFLTTVPDALKGVDANGEPKELGQFALPIDLEPGGSFDLAPYELVAGGEGEHTIRFEVVGEGIEAGTVAEEVTVTVVQPGLNLKLSGPDRVTVGSVGTYSLVVSNSGPAAATDVHVVLFAPDRGKPAVPPDAKYHLDANRRMQSISWRIPRLDKGESKQFRVPVLLERIAPYYTVTAAAHSEGFRDQKDIRLDQFTTLVAPPPFTGEDQVREHDPDRPEWLDLHQDRVIVEFGPLIAKLRIELEALAQQRTTLDDEMTARRNRIADLERQLESVQEKKRGSQSTRSNDTEPSSPRLGQPEQGPTEGRRLKSEEVDEIKPLPEPSNRSPILAPQEVDEIKPLPEPSNRSPFDVDPPREHSPFELDGPVVADPLGSGRVPRSPFDVDPIQPEGEGEPLPPETEVIDWPEWILEQTTPRPVDGLLPPEYVVEPPDLIRVEVLEERPRRPITGERLVRPDGRISLGFYGNLYVEGLTPTEIKEKVVLHLRSFLNDETLGLVEVNPVTLKPIMIHPRDTNRVFVDVVTYNSKLVYVQGEVEQQGRLTLNGRETVLDVLIEAGGPKPGEGRLDVRLIRPPADDEGGEAEIREVDWEAIVQRGDSRTNYEVKPGDRIVVERESDPAPEISRELQTIEDKIRLLDLELDHVLKTSRNLNNPSIGQLIEQRRVFLARYKQVLENLAPSDREGLAAGLRDLPSVSPNLLNTREKLYDKLEVDLSNLHQSLQNSYDQSPSPTEEEVVLMKAMIDNLESQRQRLQNIERPWPVDREGDTPVDEHGGEAGGTESPEQEPEAAEVEQGEG